MYACVPSPSGWPDSPTLRMISTPGVSLGTTNIDMRRYDDSCGSVTASTMRNEANLACEENHFSPLMTHSSPSCTAVVVNVVGSDPPAGSVIEKQETISL